MSLRVVLVRPHNHGNLGSAARAAKAFGADLAFLAARADRSHADALAYASGAEDVLASAPDLSSWDEVVGDADEVLATSSLRGRRGEGLPPSWSWAKARKAAASRRVTLVFGPERSGLTTEELRNATGLLRIATRPDLPLNLAQAVAASLALASPPSSPSERRVAGVIASASERRRMLSSLRAVLALSGFAGGGRSERVLAELDALLLRSRPSSREVSLLLGALASVEAGLRRARARSNEDVGQR